MSNSDSGDRPSLKTNTLSGYMDAVAARTSTPGGGGVTAVLAAEACALVCMVGAFTDSESAAAITANVQESKDTLLDLADADAEAFNLVMQAYRGKGDLQEALAEAAGVPVRVLDICARLLGDVEQLETTGNANLVSDIGIAALAFTAAVRACEMNILINTRSMSGDVPEPLVQAVQQCTTLALAFEAVAERVRNNLQQPQKS